MADEKRRKKQRKTEFLAANVEDVNQQSSGASLILEIYVFCIHSMFWLRIWTCKHLGGYLRLKLFVDSEWFNIHLFFYYSAYIFS